MRRRRPRPRPGGVRAWLARLMATLVPVVHYHEPQKYFSACLLSLLPDELEATDDPKQVTCEWCLQALENMGRRAPGR